MRRVWGLAVVLAAFATGVVPARAQDAAAGEIVFKRHCKICHSPLEGKNMTGPSLFKVVGRPAGSAPKFKYSQANKTSGITWDEDRIQEYLVAPRSVVPGTPMSFKGLKDPQQRLDVIGYLKTLK